MQLVKLIIPKIFNKLYQFFFTHKKACCRGLFLILLTQSGVAKAQENSPYSRYGIGDLIPQNHILNRAMGGVSAAYSDFVTINFANPASYSSFQAFTEQKSKKLIMGRAILDVGLNIDSRTLQEPGRTGKFNATNALFSYVQVGLPIKNNWGLSFGLKPVSRISYNILRNKELLKDPGTGLPIDSAITTYTGSGGAYTASLGTGFAIFEKNKGNANFQKLSVGAHVHYLFGSKEYSSRRSFINDTINYYQANFENRTNFGSLFFDAGIQFKTPINKKRNISLILGAYGSWGQKISATLDVLRETFTYDATMGNVRLDSVSDVKNIKGKLELPGSYTAGFIIQKPSVINKENGWMFGADFTMQMWDDYRFYNQRDSVRNNWILKLGAQFSPIPKVNNYFSNVAYRFGFFTGPDYIHVGNKLPQIGGSFGLGLPVRVSRQAPNQITVINLAFEYGRRGNDNNLLKESLFRASFGFSLSDFWFMKRKYD